MWRRCARLAASRVDVLKSALHTDDVSRRLAIVEGLTAHGSDAAVDALAWTAGADIAGDVVRAAMTGLMTIANRRVPASGPALRALVALLPDRLRRGEALIALARSTADTMADLAQELDADDPQIRRGVAEALSRLSHPVASASLIGALSDADAVVRRMAVEGLSRIGTRGLGRRLTVLARSDPSSTVREAAARALRRSAEPVESE